MERLIVGRERELAACEELLDAGLTEVRALVLEGEPGIGKTTLWREGVRRAEARGFRVLKARTAEAEARLSFAALADLFAAVPEDRLETLPPPQRFALDVALMRASARGRVPEQRVVAAAVLSVLRSCAAARPLLVAVDDAQWLDRPTALVLEFAARRLEGERVGILTSVRTAGGEAPRSFERPLEGTRVRRLSIGPLSMAALHEILKAQLGRSFSRPTLVRVARASAGNPFYALEIARELMRVERTHPGALPVPADVRELVQRRLRRLPAATREALLTASALSQPTVALVDAAALARAEDAEIVRIDGDSVTFVHPLYASAVYASATPGRRRSLHATLARVVDDAEERGRHLSLAATAPDEDIAQALELAAAGARSRGAWEPAAELLERARELTPPDRAEEAPRRGIQAAEHHAHAGDRPRARTLLEQVLAEPLERRDRADALRLLAEISANEENFAKTIAIYDRALEFADDLRVVVAIETGLAYVYAGCWDFANAAVHAYRALEAAEANGDDALVSGALGECVMLDYLLGRGIDWDKLERALALEDLRVVMPLQWQPSTLAGLLHAYAGRPTEARERLRSVWASAAERGDESDLAFVVIWLGWLETRSGNLETAASLANDAASLAALTGSQSLLAWALAQRAFVHSHRGEIDETRRTCAEAAALLEHVDFFLPGLWIAAALGVLELSLGNPEAAWTACVHLTEPFEAHGIGEPIPAFYLPDALEALIALGELDRAEALVDVLEAGGRELDRAWALATGGRCRGLLLAVGELAASEEALVRALAAHGRLEMPLDEARTLLCLGRVQRRLNRRRDARETLRRALQILETLDSRLWAEQARRDLERLGARRAPAELTEGELRVAELAGAGLTNKEIAARLFVSRRTVEANLARAYRKLGIRSRAELGAKMVGRVADRAGESSALMSATGATGVSAGSVSRPVTEAEPEADATDGVNLS